MATPNLCLSSPSPSFFNCEECFTADANTWLVALAYADMHGGDNAVWARGLRMIHLNAAESLHFLWLCTESQIKRYGRWASQHVCMRAMLQSPNVGRHVSYSSGAIRTRTFLRLCWWSLFLEACMSHPDAPWSIDPVLVLLFGFPSFSVFGLCST